MLAADLKAFIESPVMIVLGTGDAAGEASIGRGCGVLTGPQEWIDVCFSAWLWPRTAADIATTGRVAVTFARPSDYVTYQLKGQAHLEAPAEQHVRRARDYAERIVATLGALGLPRHLVDAWVSLRDLRVARVAVSEAFVQTPGARAGSRVP